MSKHSLCSKCCKEQPYKEITVPIKYGFNDKQRVLIQGVERICEVCGWHVDDIEVSQINHDLAVEALNKGQIYDESKADDVNESHEAEDNEENAAAGEEKVA